jgi:hypothetical protein
MPIQELVVRRNDDIWKVRLGRHLSGTQLAHMAGAGASRIVTDASATDGVRTEILIGDIDGNLAELPFLEPFAHVA